MSGWKTWLGGLVSVLIGISGFIWNYMHNEISLAFIMAGVGAMGVMGIGLGHKIEKSKG